MDMQNPKVSVLTTVNAPYKEALDEDGLVHCLKDPAMARAKAGHMSSFFGEVPAEDQVAFAAHYGIPKNQLAAAAKAFAEFSGDSYPLAG